MALLADVRVSTEIMDDESSQAMVFGGPPPKSLYLSLDGDFKVVMTSSMIRLIASMAPSTELLGRTHLERGQIDSWLSFLWHSIELPCYIIRQTRTLDKSNDAAVISQLKASLGTIEAHLMKRPDNEHSYFVGDLVSLADISFAVSMKYYGEELGTLLNRESYLDHWLTTIDRTCPLGRIP